MVLIFIQGLHDGLQEIAIEVPVSDVPNLDSEFFGNIRIKGTLRKIGHRFTLIATADCMALMICDISTDEYTELIGAELHASFIADSIKAKAFDDTTDWDSEVIIGVDDKNIDISALLREVFSVSLPMKRVSPEFREKTFEELYPEYVAKVDEVDLDDENKIDERWAPLKKLKLN